MSPAAAIRRDDDAAASEAPALTVSRPRLRRTPQEQLARAAAARGGDAIGVMRDFAALAMGPGKLHFQDYLALRLFDEAFVGGADKTVFSGRRRNSEIVARINFDAGWRSLVEHKVASAGYLGAYGFPLAPVRAIYREAPGEDEGAAAGPRLVSRAGLSAFLRRPDVYPLFAKPSDANQSLGSVVLRGLAAADAVRLGDGRETPIESFVDEVVAHYARGYVFQDLIPVAPALASTLGPWVATARVLTMLVEGRVEVLRACLKIPVGSNHADNYWRAGNLLAAVDLDTGVILSATRGAGLDAEAVLHHPDTGATLAGVALPNWRGVLELARSAQALMQHVPLIGWDIAVSSDRPLIIESNSTPDFYLNQFADRAGVLHGELLDLERRRQRESKAHVAQTKADYLRFLNHTD